MPTSPDLFDQWAAAPQASPVQDNAPTPEPQPEPAPETTPATPQPLRRALQELLRSGLLEQASKPQLFRHIASDTARAPGPSPVCAPSAPVLANTSGISSV